MRIRKQVVTKETHMVTSSITCNFCGVEYSNGDINMEPITEFTIEPGFGSGYDLEHFTLDICDICLDELLNNLKVKV